MKKQHYLVCNKIECFDANICGYVYELPKIGDTFRFLDLNKKLVALKKEIVAICTSSLANFEYSVKLDDGEIYYLQRTSLF